MRNNEYIDIHVLETVPPSCVNRDDTGSPKTAIYGGVRRARVSSQCWKRAVRSMFRDVLPNEELGLRTKYVVALLTQKIREKNISLSAKDAESWAKKALEISKVPIKIKNGNKEDPDNSITNSNKASALFFISPSQLEALAELIAASPEKPSPSKKENYQAALKICPTIDVALFGRMVADDPSLNFDAAAQVAHAISTHAVHNEYDYFTAVDDCAPEDNAGAGHLGTVEYNSATLYRYATVNVKELRKHLGNRTPEAVRVFIEAFVCSMPKGKINTFANNVLPNAVYVTLRRDQPLNLVGAFEKPVQARTGGYVQPSIEALLQHAKATYADYLGEPEVAMAVGEGMQALCDRMSFSKLLDQIEQIVRENGGEA